MKRRLVALLSVLFACLLFSTSAYAWDPGQYKDAQNQPGIPLSWNQNTLDPSIPLGFNGSNCGGCTAAKHSCTQHSMTYLLLKSGTVPQGYGYLDYRADVSKIFAQGSGGIGVLPSGLATPDAGGLQNWPGSTLTYEGTQNPRITTVDAGVAELTRLYNEGYLFYFEVAGWQNRNSHWVTMDYVDDQGVVHIMDSSRHTTTWPGDEYDGSPHRPTIRRIVLYRMADGTHPRDLPTIEELGGGTGAAGPISVNTSEFEAGEGALTDQELEGMPPLTDGERRQLELLGAQPGEEYPSELQDVTENQNLQGWGENIDREAEIARDSFVGSLVAFFGLGIMLYGAVVMFAYMIDQVNPIGVSAMKLVTMGRYAPTAFNGGSTGKVGKVRYVNSLVALIIIISIITLGAVIASGWLVHMIGKIL